jgi:hypothetical protein
LVFFDLVFFDLRFLAMRLPLCIYSSHRRLHNSHCTVSAEYEGGWRIDGLPRELRTRDNTRAI